MKINREYKYFVVDTCDWLIVSGWEYKEDALENLDDLLEGWSTAVTGDYKIYTARHLNSKDINPFNPNNWISNDYLNKTKQVKTKQVTKKEMEFLKTIACSHFGDGERLLDYITEDDYDMKVVRGLIPSLVNKGIITYHDYESETPYAVINPDYHDTESDMLMNLETIPYVKVDLSGNSDLDEYDSRLEDLLKEQFSLHEVNNIVDMIQQFSGYTKYLSKTDSNTENDFKDFLKSYLKH